jgi:hypothetical protein
MIATIAVNPNPDTPTPISRGVKNSNTHVMSPVIYHRPMSYKKMTQ